MSDRTRLRDGFYWRGSVIWTRFAGARRSTGCKDPQAAYLLRARWERESADPAHAAASSTRLDATCLKYREALRAAGRAPATLEAYTTKLGHFLRILGDARVLATITPELVEAYWTQRTKEQVSGLTLRQEITLLLSLLRWAKHKGWFPGDVEGLRPPLLGGTYVPRTAWLTPDEVKKLAAELPEHRAAWLALAIATAGRHSEVNRARREDFDLEAGLMLVRGTKTKTKHRTVPIPDFARPLLAYAFQHGAGTGGLVVRPWGRGNISTTLKAACARAKVRKVSPNDLRRTHATWLIQRGAAPNVVAFMLGHTTSAMVERVYGKQTPEAVSKLLMDRADSVPNQGSTMGSNGKHSAVIEARIPERRSRIKHAADSGRIRDGYDSSALFAPDFRLAARTPSKPVPLSYRNERRRRALNRRFRVPMGDTFGDVLDAALALDVAAVSCGSGGRGASALSSPDRSVSDRSERSLETFPVSSALATPRPHAGAREGSGSSGKTGDAS